MKRFLNHLRIKKSRFHRWFVKQVFRGSLKVGKQMVVRESRSQGSIQRGSPSLGTSVVLGRGEVVMGASVRSQREVKWSTLVNKFFFLFFFLFSVFFFLLYFMILWKPRHERDPHLLGFTCGLLDLTPLLCLAWNISHL